MIKEKLKELLINSGYSDGDIIDLFELLELSQNDILNKLKSDVED